MGLAASQARLLLLTARKSDLEYRAQMISQRKICLAMETEQLAMNYSDALNNRTMKLSIWASANASTKTQVDLTYDNLTSGLNGGSVYMVTNTATGKIVCNNVEKDVYKFVNIEKYGGKFDEQGNQVWPENMTDEQKQLKADFDTAVAKMKAQMEPLKGLNNSGYFQDLLQSGCLSIQRQVLTEAFVPVLDANGEQVKDEQDNPKTKKVVSIDWEPVLLAGMDDVSSELYRDDDQAAQAEYEHKSLLIQSQDKQLDVELKQIETQLEACKNEKESVQKLVKERAGQEFKVFG